LRARIGPADGRRHRRRTKAVRFWASPRRNSPVSLGAPRPIEGRPCQAGLLARGSAPDRRLPRSEDPVASWRQARRLQLRGQPRSCTWVPLVILIAEEPDTAEG